MAPKTSFYLAEVKKAVETIVESVQHQGTGPRFGMAYCPRFRGKYVYLDRDDGDGPGPICRLTYTGDMKSWEFAIYKYSADRYDPEEWWFPGAEMVDGTVEGALEAGMKAYQ